MDLLKAINLRVSNFKSIGPEPQGFDDLHPVNVLIGRNNSGKTALIELLAFTVTAKPEEDLFLHPYHGSSRDPLFTFDLTLSEAAIRQSFPDHETWSWNGKTAAAWEFGRDFIGETIAVAKDRDGQFVPSNYKFAFLPLAEERLKEAVRLATKPFHGKMLGRIAAERNIRPESANHDILVKSDGEGITNLLRACLTSRDFDDSVVIDQFLPDLNSIVGPDARFTKVDSKVDLDDRWEILLYEDNKGCVPLSASGSGFKTIVAVLANMVLLPAVQRHPLDRWMFAFEELENNLHPAILRRVLHYILKKTKDSGCCVVMSTHSNVVIDMLFRDDDVQLLHVAHDGVQTRVSAVEKNALVYEALEDLGARASDILQASGVVWVEGVSDRIYLEHWIGLYCEEKGLPCPSREVDFVFAEYGGKCLGSYYFGHEDDPGRSEGLERLVSASALSRNAYVVMDSDIETEGQVLGKTKLAVQEELESWTTFGREVENYIPPDVIQNLTEQTLGRFDKLADLVGDNYDKKAFALRSVAQIDAANWKTHDLEERIGELVRRILSWNSHGAADEHNGQDLGAEQADT